jgi:hypothetical protein
MSPTFTLKNADRRFGALQPGIDDHVADSRNALGQR